MAAPTSDPSTLARKLRAGDRATLARAITLVESKRADHQQAAHRLVQELLPRDRQGGARRHHRLARRRQVDHHRRARHLSDRQGPQGRGAGGRSVLDPHRRLDPRRQDAHGAARRSIRTRFIRPSPAAGTLGGVAAQDARDDADLRSRGLRRDPGRDGRHRPVGDRGRRHDRFLPRADAAGRGRRAAGHQEGRGRARRHDRGQQGRRRQHQARQGGGRRIPRGAAHPDAALADLGAAGHDLFGAHRRRHRGALGDRCWRTASSSPPPANSPRGGASSRSNGCGRCWRTASICG